MPTADHAIPLQALLTGVIAPLVDDATPNAAIPSAIHKTPQTQVLWLSETGFAGDEQADRHHHGGPDKAVHHYPAEHYPLWRDEFPSYRFEIGGFGENLSTLGMTEDSVCIGDVYQLGNARIQVSQGRSPCRKLNLRFARPDMVQAVLSTGRSGWYYRVLQPGEVAPDSTLLLLERPEPAWTVARTQHVLGGAKLDRAALGALGQVSCLAKNWRDKAMQRLLKTAS